MILIQFLQDWWSLTPDEAANGQRAVEMAQKQQYDIILMDIRMPVMNGYQAAKAIRALPGGGYRLTPILALTADTAHEVENQSEAGLFNEVITKPFDSGALRQMVARYAAHSIEQKDTPPDTTT